MENVRVKGTAGRLPGLAGLVGLSLCLSCSDPPSVEEEGGVSKVSAVTQPTGWLDTTPAAVRFSRLGINSNWENTAVAIPASAASCGANGAVIVNQGSVANGALVTKTSLTCAQSGTNCSTTSTNLSSIHVTPPGNVDVLTETSDGDITRLPNGHVLVARMLVRYFPVYGQNRHGMVAFFDSGDCGATWSEVAQIDPPAFGGTDFDMGRLFADPWSSRVYYVVQDTIQGVLKSPVFISTDAGHTWTQSAQLLFGYGAYRVTTFRTGRAYFFGANGTTGHLYQYDPSAGWSADMVMPAQWGAPTANVVDNRGITRIAQVPAGDLLRILYPTQHGTAIQQDVTVAVVQVSGSPPTATVTQTKVISSDTTGGSILGGSFVETDRSELPTAATENTAMLFWQETNGAPSSTTTAKIKGALVRDEASWTGKVLLDPNALPAFSSPFTWGNNISQGDYSRGAFFYEKTTQTMNFLGQWVDGGAVASNILRFPQSNKPEEQFAPFESLGTAPLAFASSPAISSWGVNHLDVFAEASDKSIVHRSFDSGSWSTSWDTVPNTSTAVIFAPGAVSSQSGQIDLLGVGTDGVMYYARYLSGSWGNWTNIGRPSSTTINSPPAITAWPGGRLDAFVTGADKNLWHASCNSGCTSSANWTVWASLGGSILSSGPGAAAWASGRIDVFVAGQDGSIQHKSYDSCCGGWSAWDVQGAAGNFVTSSRPGVASWGSGRLDIFAEGPGGYLYHKSWSGGSANTWLSVNATHFSMPGVAAVSWGTGRIDFVLRNDDGSMWHDSNVQ